MPFSFCLLLNGNLLLQERSSLSWSKFFHVKVSPIWKDFMAWRSQQGILKIVKIQEYCIYSVIRQSFKLAWTKSRKRYCTTPGIGVGVGSSGSGVGVSKMLNFLG